MMSILLWILKAVGMVLGSVCVLVLFLLFLLLFAPIRYRIEGNKHEEEMQIQALFSYLNPIVRIYVQYPTKQIVSVRICGILIFPKKEKVKKQETRKPKIKPEQTEETIQQLQERKNVVQEQKERVQQETLQQSQSVAQKERSEKTAKETSYQPSKQASLLWENRKSVLQVLRIILKAIKKLLPKKCRADISFGTGEPDVTGYIYAAYCSLSAYLPKGISYEPIWMERMLEGDVWMKGRLRLIYFVVAAVQIFSNKDVRLLIKKIRSV